MDLPTSSKIIIVGSGITGASTAYHLAKLGWKDITVLDQSPLFETGGSTTHAPGGVFQTNPSRMMCKFAQYTVKFLNSLKYEGKPCYHPVGGIEVSKTKERHQDLYRKMGLAHSYGLTEAKIITPEEVQKMRDAGMKAHKAGDHAKSEELMNKAMELFKS